MNALGWASVVGGGYLIGSIPWGLLLSRWTSAPDPRSVGSGNIGATNVARSGGPWLGLTTLVLDGAKAWLPAFACSRVSMEAGAVGGVAALLGHCHPPWLRFRGGKGVACLVGVAIAVGWPLGAAAFAAAWSLALLLTRIVAVASLCAAWSLPVASAIGGASGFTVGVLAAAAVLVTARHHSNLSRLRRGQEPRLGRAKRPPEVAP